MRTVLLVDDDDAFRELLRAVFEARRFNVLVAANTGEALEIAACHYVDAILTDYHMPTTNGLELCRAVKEQFAALDRRVPVWLMTGCVSLTSKEAIAAGAESLLRKPFRPSDVAARIERALHPGTPPQAQLQGRREP